MMYCNSVTGVLIIRGFKIDINYELHIFYSYIYIFINYSINNTVRGK